MGLGATGLVLDLDSVAPPGARRLLALLNTPGAPDETRLVGGAVRNPLIGRPVTDIDFATRLTPDEVTKRARAAGLAVVPTGIAFGTVTVVVDKRGHEVTTLRRDIATDGRHAVVAFGGDWAEDAARRDFTMNALYLGPDGAVHDPVGGGVADARARHVRFIGDAVTRLKEDQLRALRFFRFHAQYGLGPLDPVGRAAIIRQRHGTDRLSAERVRAELFKLLTAPGAPPTLAEMAGAGLLVDLFGVPELGLFAAAAPVFPDEPLPLLAALLARHAEDAARLAAKLKLSNADAARLAALAEHAPRLARAPEERAARRLLERLGPRVFADVARLAALHRPGAADWPALIELPARRPIPRFPLSGADLLGEGIPEGAALGQALARARARWVAGDFAADRAELLAVALAGEGA